MSFASFTQSSIGSKVPVDAVPAVAMMARGCLFWHAVLRCSRFIFSSLSIEMVWHVSPKIWQAL